MLVKTKQKLCAKRAPRQLECVDKEQFKIN